MSTLTLWNGKVEEIDVFEMLPPDEGEITIFYGRIGAGKTYAGTENIINDLKRGEIVFANWNLLWEGYDERKDRLMLAWGLIGIKKVFFDIPVKNFHFWNLVEAQIDGRTYQEFFPNVKFPKKDKDGNTIGIKTNDEIDFSDVLSRLTDCAVHLDEGHIPFDSYEATRMSEQKRSAVFAMRHFDRKLIVYTQRANSVHVNLRGNANRFFKCEKLRDFTIPIINGTSTNFTLVSGEFLRNAMISSGNCDATCADNNISTIKTFGGMIIWIGAIIGSVALFII